MQMMDQALLEAIQRKEVDPDDAFRYAADKALFTRFVTETSVMPKIRCRRLKQPRAGR